jgi:hypothetical protein
MSGIERFEQLARVARIRAEFPREQFIYLLHHHVSLPALDLESLIDQPGSNVMNLFLVLENADEFLDAVESDGRSTVVFHGHRHAGFFGELSERLQIISAPSTTMGDEAPLSAHPGPGYFVFGLRLGAEGARVIASERRNPLPRVS